VGSALVAEIDARADLIMKFSPDVDVGETLVTPGSPAVAYVYAEQSGAPSGHSGVRLATLWS
jgi:hypothetical protein